MIFVTTPAPTVLPPSRTAKRMLLLECDRSDQLDLEGDRVARHDHLYLFRQGDLAGDVGRADVELRLVAGEERRVAATFFLLQDVDFSFEFGVRLDGARLGENLAAGDVVLGSAAEEEPGVVSGDALLERIY